MKVEVKIESEQIMDGKTRKRSKYIRRRNCILQ